MVRIHFRFWRITDIAGLGAGSTRSRMTQSGQFALVESRAKLDFSAFVAFPIHVGSGFRRRG
jgi:hypothetical protein